MTPDLALVAHGPPDHPAPVAPDADEDARLLESSLREPDQFTLIFDRYFPQVHSYVARRLSSDLADDLSSETFLIAFRQRDRFDSRTGVVRAWLYGIATNLIRRHRRDEVRAWRAAAKLPALTTAAGHEDRITAQVTAQGVGRQLAGALQRSPRRTGRC
jgi:DNA-directed RNA polymerase specialized sigma24 family protein